MALDRLKPAARAVRQLQLGAEFPNVEAMYRQRSLSRLLTKRLWSVALSYAGNDGSLQVRPAARQVPRVQLVAVRASNGGTTRCTTLYTLLLALDVVAAPAEEMKFSNHRHYRMPQV